MRDFKKYDIWKLSHELTLSIYNLKYPKEEFYGISSQIRRASVSIPNNIAEGCGRDSDPEFNRFLTIVLGSASEVEYLLILSKDLKYIDGDLYSKLDHEINLVKKNIFTKTKTSLGILA